MALLEIKNLSKHFGGLHAVNDVTFSVEKGMIKGLIGPNGAGKTTLFNLISGSLKADSGAVFFNGKPIHGLAPHKIASHGVIRTFQNIKLFAKMTVLENVMIGRHIRSRCGIMSGILNLPRSWKEERLIRERSLAMLDLLGVSHLAHTDAMSLAFGQQRHVELARALAGEPVLLLLDEPAAGLNMQETERLGQTIRKIRDTGVTILLVEHDMSLVMNVSDGISALSFGQMIAEGKPRDIQKNKEVIRVYLGEEHA
ncbi:MAG TPA: ABC transporter ATP-binding protein [Chitinivibrionales bacterium]|nr:ABC transporter ATP-binding protein [Chitinivibrionales bacterium]